MKRWLGTLAVALVVQLPATFAVPGQPATKPTRPISEAEREAVVLVASFFARGPEAFVEQLTSDSPLRTLPAERLLAEITKRTGIREDTHWTLQTLEGGAAGDVAFRITHASGAEEGVLLRLQQRGDRWQLHELLTLADRESPRQQSDGSTAIPRSTTTSSHITLLPKVLRIGALVLAILGLLVIRKSRLVAVLAIVVAAITFLAASRVPTTSSAPVLQPAPPRAKAEPRLVYEGSALYEIVQARTSLTQGDSAAAAAAYRRALAFVPQRDDVYFEALPHIKDERFADSRDARLHYARAMLHGSQDALRTAWSLDPRPREDLVRDPRLLPLLRDPRTMELVALYAAEEPAIRDARLGSAPVQLPPNARALASGGFLAIDVGESTIAVPGGATLAPANARIVPATHWKEREEAAAMRDAEGLLAERVAKNPLLLARAVEALADHNRWADVLKLTDEITPQTTVVAPRLLLSRMRALLRMNRVDDARALAEGAAVKDAAMLLALADGLANKQAWDTAEKLYRQADAPEQRLQQLELRRKLGRDGVVIQTRHFDIRHDATMNPAIAARIGDLLEAELTRVRAKLPPAEPRRVAVNVFYWDDFRKGTGSDHIFGLYDGEILFPFAVVQQFKPELVAIITHELTHALVAQATGDNAPRWFQEGIAQRMELLPQHENAFHDRRAEEVLPISLLDAVMENATEYEMAADAYRVSQTFLHYLEDRYGARAIPTLIAAFAAGKNSEDALTELTGMPLDAISREFRQWGFANSANFVSDEPFPYRDLYSPGIDPRIRSGFQWTKPRKQPR